MCYAQSLDGSISKIRGIPCVLSGPESRTLTHKLRAAHDAILVGINTVIADNPHLTVRLVEGESPLPIILDSHLKIPLDSNLLTRDNLFPLVATTDSASHENQIKIEECGATIVRLPSDNRGWVDLPSLMSFLADLGVKNVMVEGGARVISSFLSQHLVDRMVITIAPVLLGGLRALEDPLNFGGRKQSKSDVRPEFSTYGYEQAGKDIIFWSTLSWSNR